MPWYGDPDALEASARQLAADAEAVRARARALRSGAAGMRWRGPAAEAFRASVAQDAQRLERAADELDEAAAAFRAHAADVRATLAAIAALERQVTGWFDRQLGVLARAAEAVSGAVRRVLDPPWVGWAWRPGTLPVPGDKAWLEVGAFLRGRGVPL